MLDFFIALFGGIYYAGKYINEKTSIEAANKRNQERLDLMTSDSQEFVDKMTDRGLERKIKQDIYRGKYKELISKVSDGVLAEAFARGINLCDDRCRPFTMREICPDYQLLIVMASIGKLPYSVASFGIRRPSNGDLWDVHAIFMEWLDKELQSHGVEPMVFQSESSPYMSVTGVRVFAKNARRVYGTFGWFSIRLHL